MLYYQLLILGPMLLLYGFFVAICPWLICIYQPNEEFLHT